MKKKNIKYEILKTSYELFKQSGYHNVSVLQICQACNISKPTFYKHVESKEKIISYYFQSIDQYIPDTWYKYGDNENHWEKIKQGYAYLIKQILTIGIDLYTENFICNLKSETPPLPNDFSFQDSMCDLIQEGQKSHQIQNMAPPIELYKIGMGLISGYGAYWCMNAGKNNLEQSFFQGLAACFQVNEEKQNEN